jgi:hypothetical protein
MKVEPSVGTSKIQNLPAKALLLLDKAPEHPSEEQLNQQMV